MKFAILEVWEFHPSFVPLVFFNFLLTIIYLLVPQKKKLHLLTKNVPYFGANLLAKKWLPFVFTVVVHQPPLDGSVQFGMPCKPYKLGRIPLARQVCGLVCGSLFSWRFSERNWLKKKKNSKNCMKLTAMGFCIFAHKNWRKCEW